MKIQIELLDEPSSYDLQFLTVLKYIKENTTSTKDYNYFAEPVKVGDLTLFSKIEVKETKPNTGVEIDLDGCWRKFHVSCKKTKGGVYKFKVWNA
jgi:hypothetical protein